MMSSSLCALPQYVCDILRIVIDTRDTYSRVGQKYKKSYYNLAQMFSFEKFCAEQFSFYKLFDSRPASLFLQGNTRKNTKGNIRILVF